MFGQIVVNDERVPAIVSEMFTHRGAGVWRDELHWGGITGGGADDDGVIHRAGLLQRLDNADDGGLLLTDGNVNANYVTAFLIDNGVDANSGLAGLPVTNDEFALATANRNHRVNGFEAGRERFLDRLAFDDARGAGFNWANFFGVDRTFTIDRLAERVHNAAEQRIADRHAENTAGALDELALFNLGEVAKNHHANVVAFKIERHAVVAAGKFEHFLGETIRQAGNAGDTVAAFKDLADFLDGDFRFEFADALAKNVGDLFGIECECVGHG